MTPRLIGLLVPLLVGLIVGFATSDWNGTRLAVAVAVAVVAAGVVTIPLLVHHERRDRSRAR